MVWETRPTGLIEGPGTLTTPLVSMNKNDSRRGVVVRPTSLTHVAQHRGCTARSQLAPDLRVCSCADVLLAIVESYLPAEAAAVVAQQGALLQPKTLPHGLVELAAGGLEEPALGGEGRSRERHQASCGPVLV